MKHYHYHIHISHYYCHHHHYMMKDDVYVGSLLLTALRGGQGHHAQSDQTAAEHEERHQHIYPIVKTPPRQQLLLKYQLQSIQYILPHRRIPERRTNYGRGNAWHCR